MRLYLLFSRKFLIYCTNFTTLSQVLLLSLAAVNSNQPTAVFVFIFYANVLFAEVLISKELKFLFICIPFVLFC